MFSLFVKGDSSRRYPPENHGLDLSIRPSAGFSVVLGSTASIRVPEINLGYMTVEGSISTQIETYRNIPYAQPPIGDLRLRAPQRIDPTVQLGRVGPRNVTYICPQFAKLEIPQNIVKKLLVQSVIAARMLSSAIRDFPEREDCLMLDVFRPVPAQPSNTTLPVVVWLYGGGFEFGSKEDNDPSGLLKHSIDMNKPVIIVTVNYRVGGFGFLPGKEVLKANATNLGLRDQRLALEWVADYIHLFGGDATRVTIWGESAGALSVLHHMVWSNDQNMYRASPLFRGAIMNSGSILPADPVDCQKSQKVYDDVCLRQLSFADFRYAIESVPSVFSYNSLMLSYLPRPDGYTLKRSTEQMVREGEFARIPLIIGHQEDEGTAFALTQNSLTSKVDVQKYLSTVFFHNAPFKTIQELVDIYTDDVAFGSPFARQAFINLYPQYKRMAAILGDITFTLTRRIFLSLSAAARNAPNCWNYIATYGSSSTLLGTYHATDLPKLFNSGQSDLPTHALQTYFIAFINDLNPNSAQRDLTDTRLIDWPIWSEKERKSLNISADSLGMVIDNYRETAYQFLKNNSEIYLRT